MKKDREDFPDLLSPMLVKELRQGMRTKIFVTAFVVLQVLMVIMMSLNALDYASNPDGFRIQELNGWFWSLCGLLLLVVMPLRGIVALSNEEKAKTLELIFLTRLTSWRIVLGKWASLMFQSLLFALAVLPYAVLRYFFGNVNLVDDLLLLALMLWMSSLITAAAVGVSGFSGFIKGAFLVLGAIFALPAGGILIGMLYGSGAVLGSVRVGGTSEAAFWILVVLDSLIAGLYLLELAAAQIAPDAENHILRKRGLALTALVVGAGLAFLKMDKELAYLQFVFSAGMLGLCSMEALCSRRPVMLAHVERFVGRGWLVTRLGRLFYPGAYSGMAFTLVAGILLLLVLVTLPGLDSIYVLRGGVFILTFMTALLTPLVIFSLVMKKWRQSPAPFFIVQVIFMVVAIFAYASASITNQRFPIEAMLFFPPPAFWILMFQGIREEELILFAISAGAALVLFFSFLLISSRPFWRHLGEMEVQALTRRGRVVSLPSSEDGARLLGEEK